MDYSLSLPRWLENAVASGGNVQFNVYQSSGFLSSLIFLTFWVGRLCRTPIYHNCGVWLYGITSSHFNRFKIHYALMIKRWSSIRRCLLGLLIIFRIILHEFSPYLSISQKAFTTFIFAKKDHNIRHHIKRYLFLLWEWVYATSRHFAKRIIMRHNL